MNNSARLDVFDENTAKVRLKFNAFLSELGPWFDRSVSAIFIFMKRTQKHQPKVHVGIKLSAHLDSVDDDDAFRRLL
jgi:hypothetical protein